VVSAAESMVILPALSAVEGSERSKSKGVCNFHRLAASFASPPGSR